MVRLVLLDTVLAANDSFTFFPGSQLAGDFVARCGVLFDAGSGIG
jgi:hypothetical protein